MSKAKWASRKSSHKSSKPSSRLEKQKFALAVVCPKCKVGRGHRCIYMATMNGHKKGEKRNDKLHRVRVKAAVKGRHHKSSK